MYRGFGAGLCPFSSPSPSLSSCVKVWEFGVVAPGYLSNAIPGDAGSPTCLNSDGCTTQLIYYDCVTSGVDRAAMGGGEGVATRPVVFAYHLTVIVLLCFACMGHN